MREGGGGCWVLVVVANSSMFCFLEDPLEGPLEEQKEHRLQMCRELCFLNRGTVRVGEDEERKLNKRAEYTAQPSTKKLGSVISKCSAQ